jgi:hypothetical protein
MNIYATQIYIEAGINYPFSHIWQRFMFRQLTLRVQPSKKFCQTYGDDFDLTFNISSKSAIERPEVFGPTVFKKDKDVEYTIFLTYDRTTTLDNLRSFDAVLQQLFAEIVNVLEKLEIDTDLLVKDAPQLIDEIIGEKSMFEFD